MHYYYYDYGLKVTERCRASAPNKWGSSVSPQRQHPWGEIAILSDAVSPIVELSRTFIIIQVTGTFSSDGYPMKMIAISIPSSSLSPLATSWT
jgi:hypothetical protein